MKWFVAFGVVDGDWLGYYGPYDDEADAFKSLDRFLGSGLWRKVVRIEDTKVIRSLTWGK